MRQTVNHPSPVRQGKRAPLRRMLGRMLRALGLAGLGLASTMSAASAQAPAQPVPQHWISYAQMASNQFQAWLGDQDSETVLRLHAWMQARLLQSGQPLPPLIVRVWVGANGKVDRLEFDSLGQPQPDSDLRALLMAEPLSEPPPPDMRQPMVLQLTLSFAAPT